MSAWPTRRKAVAPEVVDHIVACYEQQHESLAAIAQKSGLCTTTIRRLLKERGVIIRNHAATYTPLKKDTTGPPAPIAALDRDLTPQQRAAAQHAGRKEIR